MNCSIRHEAFNGSILRLKKPVNISLFVSCFLFLFSFLFFLLWSCHIKKTFLGIRWIFNEKASLLLFIAAFSELNYGAFSEDVRRSRVYNMLNLLSKHATISIQTIKISSKSHLTKTRRCHEQIWWTRRRQAIFAEEDRSRET